MLPCPFCGDIPVDDNGDCGGTIECINKECPVRPSVFMDHESDVDGYTEALRCWNTRAKAPASAPPSGFYLLSLKHTRPSDNVFTWWRPDSKGYVWAIESAGIYNEEEARQCANGSDTLAIPVAALDGLACRYLEWDNGFKLPGVKDAWRALSKSEGDE